MHKWMHTHRSECVLVVTSKNVNYCSCHRSPSYMNVIYHSTNTNACKHSWNQYSISDIKNDTF